MHLKKEFTVDAARDAAFRCVAKDETLLELFPDTKSEIVSSEGDRRTVRTHYTALGQQGTATFHFRFDADREVVRFEKVCDGRVWSKLEGEVRFSQRGDGTRIAVSMDGRTKPLVPEFTIKGALKDQLDQMARALRTRLREV